MSKAKQGYIRPKHLSRYTHESSFTGPMKHRDTGEPAMCDRCKIERGMWVHTVKKTGKQEMLCFGCGDH